MTGYMDPFPKGTLVSQEFSSNPNNGVNPSGGHTGRDYAVPVGTPVRAAGDGIIELSSWVSDNYLANAWWLTRYGGDMLVLNCGDNEPTFIYAHLSDSTAEVGAHVRKGQIIGWTGNTGTATTGPHCHVEELPPRWAFDNGTYGRVEPVFTEYYSYISVEMADKISKGKSKFMAETDFINKQQAEDIAKRAAALVLEGIKGVLDGVLVTNKQQAEDIAQRAAALVKGAK
jgi:murein DD-endopeptidase MepM/ murein hydrolase activator NlpD